MPLINCKFELKFKWPKYCVLSAAGDDDNDGDSNNIIFTIKDTQLYVILSYYQPKTTKDYRNVLVKNLKGLCIGMNIKQKVRIKTQQMSIDILSNQTF